MASDTPKAHTSTHFHAGPIRSGSVQHQRMTQPAFRARPILELAGARERQHRELDVIHEAANGAER